MNYNEFINTYNGKSFDYDGTAGVQCVDLIKMYLNKVFGLTPGAWGNAKDYYENYNNNSVLKANFDRIANTSSFVPQKGDIAVFGSGLGNTYGHICIATGEGDTHNFYSYDLNWNGKTVHKVQHNYKGFLGVLRTKDQSKVGGSTSSSVGTKKVFAVKTNIREKPSLSGIAHLYKANTTVEILEENVANADGYIWDKVRAIATGRVGYVARTNTRYK